MTGIASSLGIVACLSMSGAACAAIVPAEQGYICYGGREAPNELPDVPKACHAMTSSAEHRKLRTFP